MAFMINSVHLHVNKNQYEFCLKCSGRKKKRIVNQISDKMCIINFLKSTRMEINWSTLFIIEFRKVRYIILVSQ